MNKFYEQLLLFCSLPVYLVLIPLEMLLSRCYHLRFYTVKETLVNIYLSLANTTIDILLRGISLIILSFCAGYSWHPPMSGIVYWLSLFLLEDFLFWLEHFVDHKVRLFWAVHVTHHSSEEFNLTTGFRSSVLMPFYRYLYFVPLALLGFEPVDILFMYAITQIYGILLHTQKVKRLPSAIEFIFVTPSHHRVHHASNTPYLDKNMGMVLIIWDRLFGTFAEELPEEPPRYGLTKPLDNPHHPVEVIFHEWKSLVKDCRKSTGWREWLKYLFMPPGWSPDGSTLTTRQLQAGGRADETTVDA